ncbi:MAG: GIY-YIG nuclease family protein [Bacteroidales bacterium]|nr:GIY-YIG nuclease family protein [Bacteroidales bacterium]
METKGYIYFMTNYSNTVLYIGVTNSLTRRISEHSSGIGSAFTHKYNCNKLVYYERFPDIEQAIAREKQLKHYKREWKDSLVNSVNPDWRDLAPELISDPS